MGDVTCPGCGKQVAELAPACPNCGEKIYVEHPGDIKGVKHPPLDLPPAPKKSYGPNTIEGDRD